jgi:hypothetical protein
MLRGPPRRPANAGNGIAQGFCQGVCRPGRARTDGRQGLRRVDADVWILMRKSVDERADRRAGPLPGARARAASPATIESSSLSARLNAG